MISLSNYVFGVIVEWGAIPLSPLSSFGFSVCPSSIAMVLLPYAFNVQFLSGQNYNPLSFILGISLSGFIMLTLRSGSEVLYNSICYSTLIAIFFGVYYWVLNNYRFNRPDNQRGSFPYVSAYVLLVALVTVAVYRYGYYSMLDVPNEERSLILLGYEIHHINIGVLVLAILVPLIKEFRKSFFFATAVGFGYGSIIDQGGYYNLSEISDTSYGGMLSTISAICLFVILSISSYFVYLNKARRTTMD
jgi:hypothetical protein